MPRAKGTRAINVKARILDDFVIKTRLMESVKMEGEAIGKQVQSLLIYHQSVHHGDDYSNISPSEASPDLENGEAVDRLHLQVRMRLTPRLRRAVNR